MKYFFDFTIMLIWLIVTLILCISIIGMVILFIDKQSTDKYFAIPDKIFKSLNNEKTRTGSKIH